MKIRLIEWTGMSGVERSELCRRNGDLDGAAMETCREVFAAVQKRGDSALRDFTRRWDGVELEEIAVAEPDIDAAAGRLSSEVRAALSRAARNIETFHRHQIRNESPLDVEPGVRCWRRARPVDAVGLYVPGGRAVLPSAVLMLAIPARLAGCPDVCLCVPPAPGGGVTDEVLEAARLCGVRKVYNLGGAQAIAAMALGTESVARVAKIVGPGSRLVQAAKLLATFHGVAIDLVAGPSEVFVVADDSADPELVAADLLAQAEHGADSVAVLATDCRELAIAVQNQLQTQAEGLSRRHIVARALEQSFILLTPGVAEAMEFANRFAPEHLLLQVRDPRHWADRVDSAGSVFLGMWSPEVAGDYASGTNHTLPTGGWARSTGGVSLDTMVKQVTFQQIDPEGLRSLGPTLEVLAGIEGLDGHRQAVSRRLRRLRERAR